MTGDTEGTFTGVGGVPIFYQCAAPAAEPRGVVLIAHGYAEHLGRYREFVAHCTGRGFAVAAVDHRGHGRSGGPRGHCGTFGDFVADLRTLADRLVEKGVFPSWRAAIEGIERQMGLTVTTPLSEEVARHTTRRT